MAFPSASESFRVTGTFVRFDGTPVEGLAVNFIPPRAVQAVQNYEDDSVYPTFAVTGVTDENGKLFAAKDVDNPDREEGVELLFPYGKSLSLQDWHYIAEFVDPATNKSTRLLVNVPNTNVNLVPQPGDPEVSSGLSGWARVTNPPGIVWVPDNNTPAGLPGYIRATSSTARPSLMKPVPVDSSKDYRFEAWIRADRPGSHMYVSIQRPDGSASGYTYAIPGEESGSTSGTGHPGMYPISNKEVPTEWTRVSGRYRPNEDTREVRFTVFFNHSNGSVYDAVVDIAGLSLFPYPVESVDLSDAIPIGKRDDFDEDLEIYLQAVKDAREARDEAVAAADFLPGATVSSGEVIGDDLILTRTDSTTVNAGNVRGPEGSPTAYELRGTGSPLGVVSADPGTYYTDTAGTNGAWRWVKTSGSGTSGWTVVFGDTGWRELSGELINGWAANTLRIRRTTHEVHLTGYFLDGRDATDDTMLQGAYLAFWAPRYVTAGVKLESTTGNVGMRLTSGSWVSRSRELLSGDYFNVSWGARDSWPTSLPGTPA